MTKEEKEFFLILHDWKFIDSSKTFSGDEYWEFPINTCAGYGGWYTLSEAVECQKDINNSF